MKYNNIIKIFVFVALSLLLVDCDGTKFGGKTGVKKDNPTKGDGTEIPKDDNSIPTVNPNIKKCEEDVAYCPTEQLCTGGMGKGRKIYVINTYNGESFDHYLPADLKDIKEYTGIDFDYHEGAIFNSKDLENLKKHEYDAIWLTSGYNVYLDNELLSVIKKKVQQGVGIVLLGDNDLLSKVVDETLEYIKPDWNLKFETTLYDRGTQLVSKENTGSKVLYDHPVTSGLYKDISEGITISYLLPRDSSKISIMGGDTSLFKPIILNSSSHVSVAAVEEELSQGIPGYSNARKKNGKILQRTLMHGGFTSLYRLEHYSWAWGGKTSSTAHFFYNIACWSSGTY